VINVINSVSKSSANIVKMRDIKNIAKPKKKEEGKEKEKQRHKYNQEHKEEIKERSKKIRDEHKNEFFVCEICKILIKNHLVHENQNIIERI